MGSRYNIYFQGLVRKENKTQNLWIYSSFFLQYNLGLACHVCGPRLIVQYLKQLWLKAVRDMNILGRQHCL